MKNFLPVLVLLLLTGCQFYKNENGQWSFIRYDEGVGRDVMPLKDADQASFVPINDAYARDDRKVYWENQIITGADPGSFICLGGVYSKDRHKVFFRDMEIDHADPDSFQHIGGLWSRDKKDFYYGHTALGVLDLNSFKQINDGWAKDREAYYAIITFFHGTRVDCDYPTMKILNTGYAVDKNRAYFWGSPMKGVDLKTFHVTSDITARDKYREYRTDREEWVK
jgi:hypothetical protein